MALIKRKVQASGTSFYWAMRLLEPHRRQGMYALYAFSRDVDDIVDEPGEDAEKLNRLEAWRADIRAIYASRPPLQALATALPGPIDDFSLQQEDFLAVIDGCAMDVGAGMRRPSMAELDLYCDRVASAVGRLSVRIFGSFVPDCLQVAYHQGRALQLTNILRDVVVDANIGRLYLPDEVLSGHGIAGDDIAAVLAHPALHEACRSLGDMARLHFTEARRAMARCSPRAMRPARMMLEMYAAHFRNCEANGWVPRATPPSVSKAFKIWCALRYGLL
jgi:phytoene synthase